MIKITVRHQLARAAHQEAPRAQRPPAPGPVSRVRVQYQRPRGSLSSCSSSSPELSATGDTEPDEPDERARAPAAWPAPHAHPADHEPPRARQKLAAPDAHDHRKPANRPHHHTRSISLLINPQFASPDPDPFADSDSDSDSCAFESAAKSERPRAPRRTNPKRDRRAELAQSAPGAAHPEGAAHQPATSVTDAEVAKLRQIGFLLRQISDDFSR